MIYLNGTPVPTTRFPDNTSQVWKIPVIQLRMSPTAHVRWDYSHEAEFLELAQLKDLLDQEWYQSTLEITYLPYGRQDKDVSNEATFGLLTFAKLINSLNFDKVTIHDPHSSVALDLINNSSAVYPRNQIQELIHSGCIDIACYPDKGARIKYSGVYADLIGNAHVYGEKVRDQLTGNITKYELVGGERVRGKKVMIIDDICDGGMTFKILAKDLLEAGATEVNLFVTHGIFSKGVNTLKESGINHVFTKDGEAFHMRDAAKGCIVKPFNKG